MEKLYLEPIDESYAIQPPQDEVLSVQLDGGAGRYRADIDGGSTTVAASWVLDAIQYQYLWAFFRSSINRGADPFLIDLDVEGLGYGEQTAHFVPGSLQLTGKQGEIYMVSARLEVMAPDGDTDFDASIVDAFEAMGDSTDLSLDLLSQIVNEAWPTA